MVSETNFDNIDNDNISSEIKYKTEKDFYRGIGGELRYKAEGLFKKAKEKGISIEEVTIEELKENKAEFPGIGALDLPAFMVKIKGRDISTGQVIVDGKQIDYYNRYQKYLAQRIEQKNAVKDENGRYIYENKRPKIKENKEFSLSDWERFEIGKELIEDKEFGIEKTITGACDRIIRKLMGENDWLYADEARLLDEEFNTIQNKSGNDSEFKKANSGNKKLATVKQVNYLKQRIKAMGLDPEDNNVVRNIFSELGINNSGIGELSMSNMSKVIDNLNVVIPKVKENITKSSNYYNSESMDKDGKDLQ